jgi:hypothetical protein
MDVSARPEDPLQNKMKWNERLELALQIITIIFLIALLMNSEKSGMTGSDPRLATTMGGTAGLRLSDSGPVVHQNDMYMRDDSNLVPSGSTMSSNAATIGATLALRSAKYGGDNGPQDFNN